MKTRIQTAGLKKSARWMLVLIAVCSLKSEMIVFASSGTEGAAFLDIPVGGGPAAMGASYTALANDAYAATYNPGGLGFLGAMQFSGQHLSYLDSLHYEYLSFAVPLPHKKACSSGDCPGSALGGSIQYLGSGDVAGTDIGGNPTGDFSSYYASYNLSYGRSFNDKLSLGITGKMIRAQLDDVSASAFGTDFGGMYKLKPNLTVAATLNNIGSKLKFLDDGDPLPLSFHLAGAYRYDAHWMATSELVVPKTGLVSFHMGGEWRPLDMLALRMGYRTDTVKELSALAGYSAGVGLNVWGQELAYAWLPYGDLGNTHYISLLMKFGEVERAKRNLIQYQRIKKHQSVATPESAIAPDYMQLMELLSNNEQNVAKKMMGNENEIQ